MLEKWQNNKIKSKLVAQLTVNWIISVVLLVLLYLYIPSIDEISDKKIATNLLFDDYSKTTKEWLSFTDFNLNKVSLWNLDSYKKNILISLDSSFYNKFFINKWNTSYESFLTTLAKSTNENILSNDFKQKQNLISTVLPVYSNSALTEWTITDSTFINNIETLIEKFNLYTSDSISISNFFPVEDISVDSKKNNKSVLDSEIYYFKIPLKLTGTKKDIINFIHYLENVWSIWISWNNIKIHKDSLSNYEWQVAEISSLKIASYIDSDTSTIYTWDFANFLKNNQWNEKLDIDLAINFYVKGLAAYKVQDFVNSLNIEYGKISKETQSLISKINQKDPNLIVVFNKVSSIKKYLDTIKKDVSDLFVKSKKWDDLGTIYSQAYKLKTEITNLSAILESQKKIISSLKNNK